MPTLFASVPMEMNSGRRLPSEKLLTSGNRPSLKIMTSVGICSGPPPERFMLPVICSTTPSSADRRGLACPSASSNAADRRVGRCVCGMRSTAAFRSDLRFV